MMIWKVADESIFVCAPHKRRMIIIGRIIPAELAIKVGLDAAVSIGRTVRPIENWPTYFF